jgi:sugar diacid utilization regulator
VALLMPSVDEILASSPLAGLCRVSGSGGGRPVALVRLAESFTDLDRAPAASLVILSRLASAEISDYRLDMALRWAAIHQVAAVAAFADKPWQPTVTARDIAARADIALISIPAGTEAAGLVQAILREIGGGAELALGRAEQGLAAVLSVESARGGVEELRAAVAEALGTRVEFRPWPNGHGAVALGDRATDNAAARAAADGGPTAANGGPTTADGGPTTADGGPTTADGGPTTADGGPTTADGGLGGPPGADQPGSLLAGDRSGAPLTGASMAAGRSGAPLAGAPLAGDRPGASATGAPPAADRSGARDPALGGAADGEISAQVVVGETPVGSFVAPDAHGDFGVAVRLVLHTAAMTAGRLLDLARQAREVPVRSRSELLAELLMSDSAINEDLLERARQLAIPIGGWHVVVRIEADDLQDAEPDEVQRFELLEAAGQAALHAVAATGGTWYLSRIARAIVLVRITTSNPGPRAGARAARSAERALEAIKGRLPGLRFRAGVGAPHEGPTGLRASAAEARGALLAARAGLKPPGVAAHDAVGVRRMLMEWYASDTARASVRDQLAPLEKLGPARADTAIRTLAAYLDEQGSIIKTAQRLHLHRNAVANRLRGITELLEMDLDDPDQRLALQLACRARLLD